MHETIDSLIQKRVSEILKQGKIPENQDIVETDNIGEVI
jgi:hypothetical protein